MKTLIIIILSIIGYLAIGFMMLIFHAKKYVIDEQDTVLFLVLWPIVTMCRSADKAVAWATNTARYLSKKLPK